MTSKKVDERNKYPTTVKVPAGEMEVDGLIMCNQLLTIDKADLIAHKATLTASQINELNEALRVGVGIPRRLVA